MACYIERFSLQEIISFNFSRQNTDVARPRSLALRFPRKTAIVHQIHGRHVRFVDFTKLQATSLRVFEL